MSKLKQNPFLFMTFLQKVKLLQIIFVFLTNFVAISTWSEAKSRPRIYIDGSSTVFPISEAVAEEFLKSKRGKFQVTVGVSGTGGGFKKFCRGHLDIVNASRSINEKEIETCKKNHVLFYELPIAWDAIVVAVNPKNSWIRSLSVETLKKIWEPAAQAKIMSWRDINANYPDQPLHLYGPGTDSGTFDFFTEVINGKARSSRGDFSASEDDHAIIQGLIQDEFGLGYMGLAYYKAHSSKLKALAILNPKNHVEVTPDPASVKSGSYYPLSRPLFVYVNRESFLNKPHVREFVEFYLTQAHDLSQEVGYVPLNKSQYDKVMAFVRSDRHGTNFHGQEFQGHLDRILDERK